MVTASSNLILTKKVVKDICCLLFADELFRIEYVIVSHFLWNDVIFRTDKNGPQGLKPRCHKCVVGVPVPVQDCGDIYGLTGAVASRPHSRQQ